MLMNIIIAVALILVKSYHNLLFLGVIIVNTVIGIFQELRSKRTLEKLSLVNAAKATVIRDGQQVVISVHDIVEDDIIIFQNGDQITVDAVVLDGEAEVNESLLTGEADAIVKKRDAELLSGSFVVSGSCVARAVRVGENSYASKLTSEAKKYKRLHSQLMASINSIIRFTSAFMIPFAVILMACEWFSDHFVAKDAVTSTAAALIGMMPQGLILLTTVSLVVGVIKLAKKNTLVQELYCIETLSRVSLLCLDKTGTITKGTMSVSEVVPLSDNMSVAARNELIAAAIHAIGDQNATAVAVRTYFGDSTTSDYVTTQTRPFSSDRKWSSVSFDGVGTVFFGAYDRLLNTPPSSQLVQFESKGKRILLVAFCEKEHADPKTDHLTPLAALIIEDEIRENAKEILDFFRKEDVQLRVISGDHPATVSAIAKEAGLDGWHKAVDASTIKTDEALRDAAANYVVFGRVSPRQKKKLVTLFKEQGHTVAMTGDGVNDVPALKAADCSIAMAAGSDAAKQVSQLVLLDSDFASLPTVVMEGRRVINNITRTASLFLVKTIMSFLVTLCAIATPMDYPFEPLQLTLIAVFAESIPGFFLTLEPCRDRVKGHFLHTVLSHAVPSAVIITAAVLLTQLLFAPLFGLSAEQSSTLCVYLTGLTWLVQLTRVSRPLNLARGVLCATMTIGFFAGALLLANALPALMAFIGFPIETVFVLPNETMAIITMLSAVVIIPLDMALYALSKRVFTKAK